jgi:hypothetical protein
MNVLTRYGGVTLSSLSVGSRVIAGDDVRQPNLSGDEALITSIEIGEKDLYKITLTDGTELERGLDSLWQVKEESASIWSIVVLDELLTWFPNKIDPYYCACSSNPYIKARYEIRQVQYYIPFSNILLDSIPPYWIGVFATKGCLEGPEPFLYLDREEASRIRDQGSWDFILMEPYTTTPDKYFFRSYTYINERSKLSIELENLGLLFKSKEERLIHNSYIYSDFRDRVNLIQGIMDSVGYIDPITGISIALLSNQGIAKQLEFIVRTLGGTTTTYYDSKVREYLVSVYLPRTETPFSRPSLVNRYTYFEPKLTPIYIESIERLDERGLVTSINLENNQPYITDEFLVIY